MTTFYTKIFRTFPTRFLLVLVTCFGYTYANAQCNPDETAPVAVCDAFLNVALDGNGQAIIFAETFDDGSFDNCCPVTLQVRRDGSTCAGFEDDAMFGESVTFCCDDANNGNSIFVILEVSDCNNNINTCFTEVMVEDKLAPTVTCPANTEITCGSFYDNLHEAYLTSNDSLNTAMNQLTGDATIFDNCQAFSSIQNVFSNTNFCEDFTIERTWIVSDGNSGNANASCTQIVQVIYENVWDVTFPADMTVNDFGMATPDFTGMPIITQSSCGLFAEAYEDEVFDSSDGCAKIIRTWTVINWCSGDVMQETQIIDVEGNNPPTIECPADFVVYLNTNTGDANVTVPLPTTTGDINNYTVTATSDLPNFNATDFSANNVLAGTYTTTFTVNDFCENAATCSVTINVEELGNVNCPANTTIDCDVYQNDLEDLLASLEGDAEAQNEALDPFFGTPSFQTGTNISSHVTIDVDACGQGTLTRVWELDDDEPTGNCFMPMVSSSSANNGDEVCVDVTVNGFENILSFQYSMNFDPTLLAFNGINDPENIDDLNFGINNTTDGHFGVSWFDNDVMGVTIASGTLLYQVCFEVINGNDQTVNIDISNSPTNIEVVDGNEEYVCFSSTSGQVIIGMNTPEALVVNPPPTVLCTQVITVEYTADWSVIFPENTTANCTFGTLDAGEPEIIDGGCGLFGISYEDVVFNDTPNGDYQIQRTWTVINWCDNSIETHTQIITVNDAAAPSFVNNCNLPDVCLEGNQFSCVGGMMIPMPEVLDCSSDIDLTASSDFGNGFGPFVNVESGQYLVTFTATDPLGNTTTCVSNINVVDCIAPVAVCKEGVVISLTENSNGDGVASIFVTDLNDGSYDNCSSNVDYSFAANVTLSTFDFDCSDLGSNNVTLYVTDENGNQNSCISEVVVEDLLNLCPANPCDGSSLPNLVCNSEVQVSLDANGEAAVIFDMVLEGLSGDCIDQLDLSFSANTDIDILNFNCSNLGNNVATVYLMNNNGVQNSCWSMISINDQIEVCNDPIDCNNDTVAPVANCKDGVALELLYTDDPNNMGLEPQITLYASDIDNGSFDNCTNPVNFSFSSDITNNEIIYNCNNIGENAVSLWVTDASGNQTICSTFIIVQANQGQCNGSDDCQLDDIFPVAICESEVIVSLALSGEATIFTEVIDNGSYDNCPNFQLSFSPDGNDITTTFDCNDLGENTITLYVTDNNGNQNQCWTNVIIEDNLNACNNACLNDTTDPEAFCISALVIQMPNTGMLTLNASLFDIGSSDNCTNDLDLQISTIDGNGEIISGPASGLPFNINNVGANNIVLTVTDAAGNTDECHTILLLQSNPPQVVRGKIFVDANDDCTYNTGEMGLDTWQVKLEAIDDTLATEPGIVVLPPDFTIDAEGNYTITLPEDFVFFTPDSSVVNVNNLNPYLRVSLATGFNYGQTCEYNYFINSTTNTLDTIEIDFPVQVLEDCPQLSVDISTPYLRRCFENNYTVNYCNFGSVNAEDAYIEVDFDEFLEINSSTLPWISVDGTTYRFDLGTVNAAECGSFEVNVTVSCDAVLGQTHCTQANIYPAVLCDPMSPEWSGASIDITGECTGDEVKFTITNIGDNDMDSDAQFIVIEDFIMYNTGTFNLVAGGSTEITMPANGSTWRVEADQVSNHPGRSMPSLAIEGCSTDGNFSLGMVTQFVQNDNDPFVSISCLENIGSFDPNDKMATVIGYGDEHYIDQNTDIEYMIRFQNTGTDTAFNVVVIDTLDISLDPLSVRPGASSHPYDFTILGDNVLKFNFDNIALPDSNINEVASHGYIKFRVSQYPDVALETMIENNAAIYFDFNEPIITNVVFHTIGQHFLEMPNATGETPTSMASIKVFPNPFEEEATVEIDGLEVQNGVFKIFDMQGRLMQAYDFAGSKFSVKREELPSGMYFYQIESKTTGLLNSGKLAIK